VQQSTLGYKILEAIALAGGLMTSFLGFGSIIYQHYQQFIVIQSLMN
jgi:hypothetical protein